MQAAARRRGAERYGRDAEPLERLEAGRAILAVDVQHEHTVVRAAGDGHVGGGLGVKPSTHRVGITAASVKPFGASNSSGSLLRLLMARMKKPRRASSSAASLRGLSPSSIVV